MAGDGDERPEWCVRRVDKIVFGTVDVLTIRWMRGEALCFAVYVSERNVRFGVQPSIHKFRVVRNVSSTRMFTLVARQSINAPRNNYLYGTAIRYAFTQTGTPDNTIASRIVYIYTQKIRTRRDARI